MTTTRWVLQQRADATFLLARVEQVKGRWQCRGIETLESLPARLAGEVHYTVSSPRCVVLVDDFPHLGKEMLLMQMNRRLDQLAMLESGSRGAVCYAPLEKRGAKQSCVMVVIPEQEVEDALDAVLASRRVRLRNCVAEPASIAALVDQAGGGAHIVLLIQQESASILGVRDGIALYRQMLQVTDTGEVEGTILMHAINYCRQTLNREFGIDDAKIVSLGIGRKTVDGVLMAEGLTPLDLGAVLLGDNDEVLDHPELFGAIFARSDFSYLPREYSQSLALGRVSKWLIGVAVAVALALGLLAWQNSERNATLATNLTGQHQLLLENIGRVEAQLPGMESVKVQEQYLQILAKSGKEAKLTDIFMTLADRLPEHVQVAALEVDKRAKPSVEDTAAPPPGSEMDVSVAPVASTGGEPMADADGGSAAPANEAENELDKELLVILTLSSKGEYELVRARFEKTVNQFSEKFVLDEIMWKYIENTEEGILSCQLKLP